MSFNEHLELVHFIQYQVLTGRSMQSACQLYLKLHPDSRFMRWWMVRDSKGIDPHLLMLLEYGLKGAPIQKSLQSLKEELVRKQKIQIDAEIDKLPLIATLPILLFIFPAYMILLFAPFLSPILTLLKE